MDPNDAVRVADAVVFEKVQRHLKDVELAILRGALSNQTYREIADQLGYSDRYISQDVGPALWDLLSAALGEPVTKRNFRSALERCLAVKDSAPPLPNTFFNSLPNHLPSRGGSLDIESSPNLLRSAEGINGQDGQRSPPTVRQDWGELNIDVARFFGRDGELNNLAARMGRQPNGDRPPARLVTVCGAAGIGKTALAVKLAKRVLNQFEVVFCRSLANDVSLSAVFQDLLRCIAPGDETTLPPDSNRQIQQVMDWLARHRCLVILDQIESIFRAQVQAGFYRPGYEAYGEFFRRMANASHMSCLVLSGREQPRDLAYLTGDRVQALTLSGLPWAAGRQIVDANRSLVATEAEWQALIHYYDGNPKTLEMVAFRIANVWAGNVSQFLQWVQERELGVELIGDIQALLWEQWGRLSPLEQEVMYWLAIGGEPMTLGDLKNDLNGHEAARRLPDALESLRQRSLISQEGPWFAQSPVVSEFILEQLVEQVVDELQNLRPRLLMSHALIKAHTKEYLRDRQQRRILQPIAARLQDACRHSGSLEDTLKRMIGLLREQFYNAPGYGGGNLLNLCAHLRVNLAGYDFSYLSLWQAYVPTTALVNVNLAHANLGRSMFAQALGSRLVTAFRPNGQLVTADDSGEIALWQVSDWHRAAGTLIAKFSERVGVVEVLAVSPDGQRLASGESDGTVRLWHLDSGQCLSVLRGHGDCISVLCFSPDGQQLASGSGDGAIALWQTHSGYCLHRLLGHSDAVQGIAFSPVRAQTPRGNGLTLVSLGRDQTVRQWSVGTGALLQTVDSPSYLVGAIAVDASGQVIVAISDDHLIRLWHAHTGQWFQLLNKHHDAVVQLAFALTSGLASSAPTIPASDGLILASVSHDPSIKLWDVTTGDCLQTLAIDAHGVHSLAFSPDGQMLASGGTSAMVKLWERQTGRCLHTMRAIQCQLRALALSPDARLIACGNDDHTIHLWGSSGRCMQILAGHSEWISALAFSPTADILASGSYDHTIKLWDTATGRLVATLTGHRGAVADLCFSATGDRLVSASDDHTLKYWQWQTHRCQETLSGHSDRVKAIALSPDGRLIASGGRDRQIKCWDGQTGTCLQTIAAHDSRIHALQFDATGARLISGSYDGTAKVWDVNTGTALHTWRPDAVGWVRAVTFESGESGDRPLVCSSDRRHLYLWDGRSGQCLNTLDRPPHDDWFVNFSADDQWLVCASADGTISLWSRDSQVWTRSLSVNRPYEGMNITGVGAISPAQRQTLKDLGAIEA